MKNFVYDVNDAANISFVVSQTAHIESVVLKKKYPAITYAQDIPVDTSANPFATSVTFYASDNIGAAKVMNGKGDDMPLANIDLQKLDNAVSMAGIGYSFSLEEIGQAQMLGMNLDTMGADSANFAYEKFVDAVAYTGNTAMGVTGLYNTAGITTSSATGLFSALTPDQVLLNVNALLSGPYSASLGVEMADTLKLPLTVFADLAQRRLTDTSMPLLVYIREANIFTATTGRPLMIGGDHRLTTRAVAYAKDPEVLKLHIPMPLRFLPPQPRNLGYVVPGMFRLAGLDIRRRASIRYMDGVA